MWELRKRFLQGVQTFSPPQITNGEPVVNKHKYYFYLILIQHVQGSLTWIKWLDQHRLLWIDNLCKGIGISTQPLRCFQCGLERFTTSRLVSSFCKKMNKKHLLVLVVEIINWRDVNCPHLEIFLALDGISPPLFRQGKRETRQCDRFQLRTANCEQPDGWLVDQVSHYKRSTVLCGSILILNP